MFSLRKGMKHRILIAHPKSLSSGRRSRGERLSPLQICRLTHNPPPPPNLAVLKAEGQAPSRVWHSRVLGEHAIHYLKRPPPHVPTLLSARQQHEPIGRLVAPLLSCLWTTYEGAQGGVEYCFTRQGQWHSDNCWCPKRAQEKLCGRAISLTPGCGWPRSRVQLHKNWRKKTLKLPTL